MMEHYQYIFSVIMAVYNVEDYLSDAIDSLVNQTLGFSNIQVILVDDGSTDSSGAICDKYAKLYPENVAAIHKENGGAASARNVGLQYSCGKYINFLDSDDTLDSNALDEVSSFMEHNEQVDICCIPIVFFGNVRGNHPLNYKFASGNRVVDLSKDEDCPLLSASSAFYRADNTRNVLFDIRLKYAEDAKRNLRILIENPLLGIVTGTKYNYRKHGNSILDGSSKNPVWYLPYIYYFSKWALDVAEEKWGSVPKWIQNTVMYDLQWRLRQSHIPYGIISENEAAEYTSVLFEVASRIDDDIIKNQKNLQVEDKVLVLSKKYHMEPVIHLRRDVDAERLVKNADYKVGHSELCFGEFIAADISDMTTVLEFISIDESQKTCTLEGYHRICGISEKRIYPFLLINGEIIRCEEIDRSRKKRIVLGEMSGYAVGFRASFSVKDRENQVIPGLFVDDMLVLRQRYWYGGFFPVSGVYKSGYALVNHQLIRIKNKSICISSYPSLLERIVLECNLLSEIWNRNLLGGRKAIVGRLFYHIIEPLKKSDLWIISDRIMRADDNGEALFRYLKIHHPKDTHIVFALSKKSPDFARISSIGRCVDSMSFIHKLLHLICDVNISSHAEGSVVNPFEGHHEALRDLLVHQRFVFLQHGITKDDLSDWLNKYNKNITGLITAAPIEQESIQNGDYGYTQENVWLTGFPRFDLLYRDERKLITIMPSWRRYLMGALDGKTGIWQIGKKWKESRYYKFYNALLNSDYLINKIEEYGYNLQFYPHPNLQPYMDSFDHNPKVMFLPQNTSYREIYAQSDLLITDYSSAVFDFAFLRKPILYCQFDKEEFFSGEHVYTKGYFDYERDGFGEVTYNLEDTIACIVEYISSNCQLKDIYRERIDSFFAFNDQNNCQRVTEKILDLTH